MAAFPLPSNIVQREAYISRVKPFIGKSVAKVFTGQRRVGKSYMLFQITKNYETTYVQASLLFPCANFSSATNFWSNTYKNKTKIRRTILRGFLIYREIAIGRGRGRLLQYTTEPEKPFLRVDNTNPDLDETVKQMLIKILPEIKFDPVDVI